MHSHIFVFVDFGELHLAPNSDQLGSGSIAFSTFNLFMYCKENFVYFNR
jgi:hypothetical protein